MDHQLISHYRSNRYTYLPKPTIQPFCHLHQSLALCLNRSWNAAPNTRHIGVSGFSLCPCSDLGWYSSVRCTSKIIFSPSFSIPDQEVKLTVVYYVQQEAALAGIQTTGCKTSDIACICKATAFLTELKSTLGSICSEADQKSTTSPSPPPPGGLSARKPLQKFSW